MTCTFDHLDRRESALCMSDHGPAPGRESDSFPPALKESQPQFFFQPSDSAANGGGVQLQGLCGASEVPDLSGSNDVL